MLSVYYNINDEGHIIVKEWLHSKDTWEANTPKTDKIWKILRSNQNIAGFDDKLLLRNRFNALSYLHNYVHTKGFKFSNQLGRLKSNHQTFEEHALLNWLSAFEEIILILITLHMLKYPISIIKFDWSKKIGIDNPFPVLEEFEIEKIEELLPENYIQEIASIAREDVFTQNLFGHIKSLPDMTETEQKEQILEHDMMMIENGQGFLEWKKFQLSISKNLSPEGKAELKSRIEKLHQWALENNMMKPKIERLEEEGFFQKPPDQK
ncbi:MAG: hypothetical protein CMO08_05250 [Thalassospira sp.]|nr:hypothetical protein [Thalassospira sp.]